MGQATTLTDSVMRLGRGPLLALAMLLACDASSSVEADSDAALEEAEPVEALPRALASRVATYVEQYGRHWPTFRFHGVVLVARGEQVAVHQAFGQSDLIGGVPNETGTVFRLGTLSAQLTAAAVMRLHEAGALQLEDPVAKHLPEWPGGEAITIEQLLSHRSGIPNFTDDIAFDRFKLREHSLDETLELFRGHPLELEPGSDTAPSNSNTVLLGAILERVAGKPYQQVVTEQVLAPLHMDHTRYGSTDEPQAIGMTFNEDEFLEVVTTVHPSAFGPAGGWLSTSGDLLRWVRGLRDGTFLSKRSVAQMQGLLGEGLGYGWTLDEVAGREVTTWPGLIDGFNGSVLYVPADDTTIIVLSNSEVVPAGQLVHDIATLVYEDTFTRWDEPQAMPVPLSEQRPAVGRYVLTRGSEESLAAADPEAMEQLREVFVRERGDHLVFEVPDHGRKLMHPLGDGQYFFQDGAQTQARVVVRPEQATLLVLEAGGVEVRFVGMAEGQDR